MSRHSKVSCLTQVRVLSYHEFRCLRCYEMMHLQEEVKILFNLSVGEELCQIENQQYLQSGKTCAGLDTGEQSSEPGCHCINGLYWNEYTEKCVVKTECGCDHEGVYFEQNATSPIDCSL